MTHLNDISSLQDQLRAFASDRDWRQFHNPKNLVMALMGEVGELAEIFQWLTCEESGNVMEADSVAEHVREELADVFGYVLRIADVLSVDLLDALTEKIKLNDEKYPVEKAKGNARKYTELS